MPVCLQAPVTFKLSEPTGQPGYLVTVYNKHSFISTEGLLFDFRVMADGVPIRQEGDEGWTHFDIAHIPAQVCPRHQQLFGVSLSVCDSVCSDMP